MLYNQPLDKPSNPNAPYVDGNPNAGIQGSIVPAASIEYDQREVVEVITRANARGYSDFSGAPCAAPINSDLTQLRKAIEGFITGWSFIIDTTITFKVHGAGYDFVDLNAAMSYLRKYYITTRGHVILQLAGAAQGATTAVQYTYAGGIYISHPNANRISIFGARMLAPMPPNISGYANNGFSPGQRAADTNTNLTMLRSKFATELHLTSAGGVLVYNGPNLMHLDAILLTGDGSASNGISSVATYGMMNQDTYSGLGIVGFGGIGLMLELGATSGFEGTAVNENNLTNVACIGNGGGGCAISDGSYITMTGNLICVSNGSNGLWMWPRSGSQFDGAVDTGSNAQHGIQSYLNPTNFLMGPLSGNPTPYRASSITNNGGWGYFAQSSFADVYGSFGGNASGSIWAGYGSNIHALAGDLGISSSCSPPWGVIGNANAFIG
jgi:hypothetical protein